MRAASKARRWMSALYSDDSSECQESCTQLQVWNSDKFIWLIWTFLAREATFTDNWLPRLIQATRRTNVIVFSRSSKCTLKQWSNCEMRSTEKVFCNSGRQNLRGEPRNWILKSTAEKLELRLLKEVEFSGWPENDKKMPEAVKKYKNFKEEIIFEQGLLFKGHIVIVPQAKRNKIIRAMWEWQLDWQERVNFFIGMDKAATLASTSKSA